MPSNDTELTRNFYDRISRAYDVLADSGEHAARERGLAALDVQVGEHVLEIGYGTGHSIVELASRVGIDGTVSGIDISQGMHDAARRRLQKEGLAEQVDLRVGVVPPLPWPEGSFDVVTMSFTLELFPLNVIPLVLTEVRRVLRPGGRLGVVAMSVTPAGEQDSLLEKTYKWMHQHFPHIVDCQPIAAARLVEEAGLTLTHQESVDIWTMPVAILVGQVDRDTGA